MKSKKLILQEIQERLFNILKNSLTDQNRREIMLLEAYLLMFYGNYKYESHMRPHLYERGKDFNDSNKKLNVHSMLGTSFDSEFMAAILNIERNDYDATSLSLNHFIDRIDLLEPMIV